MLTAFQILLICNIVLCTFGIIGEKEDKDLRGILIASQIASLIAYLITLFLF